MGAFYRISGKESESNGAILDSILSCDHLMQRPAHWTTLMNSDPQKMIQIELAEKLILPISDFLAGRFSFDRFLLTLPNRVKSQTEDNFFFEDYPCNLQIMNELLFPQEELIKTETFFDQLKEICLDPTLIHGYVNAIVIYLITNHLLIDYLNTTLLKHLLLDHIQKYVDHVKSYQAFNFCLLETQGLITKILPANPESESILVMNQKDQMISFPTIFRVILDTGNSATTYVGHEIVKFLGLKPQEFCNVTSVVSEVVF